MTPTNAKVGLYQSMTRSLVIPALTMMAGFALARLVSRPDTDPERLRERLPEAVAAVVTKPPGPIPEAIVAAYDPRSEAVSAHRTLPLIEALTVEDFRRIEQNPELVRCAKADDPSPGEFLQGYFDTIVKRWLEVDPEAEARIPRLGAVLENRFARAFAQHRPRHVLDTLPSDLEDTYETTGQYSPLWVALTALVQTNAPEAFRRVDALVSVPETTRHELQRGMTTALATVDPIAAAARAVASDDETCLRAAIASAARIGHGTLRQVLALRGEKFANLWVPDEVVRQYPTEDWSIAEDRRELVNSVADYANARRISQKERRQLLDRLGELPALTRGPLAKTLVSAWSLEDPASAVAWAWASLSPELKAEECFSRVAPAFRQWREREAEAAMLWLREQPSSPLRSQLLREAVRGIEGTIQCLPMLAGETRGNALSSLAWEMGKTQFTRGIAFADTLPANERSSFFKSVLQGAKYADTDATAKWVLTLPRGPDRDNGCAIFAEMYSERWAEAAWWAEQIDKPALQEPYAGSIFYEWLRFDAPAARSWLRTSSRLDANFAEILIQKSLQ